MGEVVAFARARNAPDEAISTRIYVIASESGHVKVGVSDDPIRRLKALQTANPYRLRIRHMTNPWPRQDAFGIERQIHERLAETFAQRGEWFTCTGDDAIFAIIDVARAMMDSPSMGEIL